MAIICTSWVVLLVGANLMMWQSVPGIRLKIFSILTIIKMEMVMTNLLMVMGLRRVM